MRVRVPIPPQLPLRFLDMPLTLLAYDGDIAICVDRDNKVYRMVGCICQELDIQPGCCFDFGMYKHQMWLHVYELMIHRAEAERSWGRWFLSFFRRRQHAPS